MNLLDHHPKDLAEQAEPAAVLAELRQLDALGKDQAGTLDVFLNHWIVVVMSRGADRESVLELLDICEVAESLLPAKAHGPQYMARWRAFHNVLEGKRRLISAFKKGRRVELKQGPELLRVIGAQGEMTQSDLAQAMELSAGRISQLLGVLEEQGEVVRARRGKESFVSIAKGTAGKIPAARPGGPGAGDSRWHGYGHDFWGATPKAA